MYKQLAKYITIGFFGAMINIMLLYSFVEFLQFSYILGATAACIAVISNNFFWNKKWTFQNSHLGYKKQYFKYFLVSTFGLILNLSILTFFISIFQVWYILAQLFSIAIVGIGTFLSNKYWTFNL